MKFFWQKEKELQKNYTFIGTTVEKCGVIAALQSNKDLRDAFQAQFGKLSFSTFRNGRMKCRLTCKPRNEKSARLAFAYFASCVKNNSDLSVSLIDKTANDLFYASLGMVVIDGDKTRDVPVNAARSFKNMLETDLKIAQAIVNDLAGRKVSGLLK